MDNNAYLAVKKRDLSKLKDLLEAGIDINAKDANHYTLLHHAVNQSKADVVKFLLENGIDVLLATERNVTALHIAVSKNCVTTLRILLENISSRDKLIQLLDAKTKTTGSAPLHLAASNGYHQAAEVLLVSGANYEIQNSEGKTPAQLIEQSSHPHSKLGGLLNFIDTSFQLAKLGDDQLEDNLGNHCQLNHLASVFNCRDNEGHTILQVLVINGHYRLAKLLIMMRRASLPTWCYPMYDLERSDDVDCLVKVVENFQDIWRDSLTKIKDDSDVDMLVVGSCCLEKARDVLQSYKEFEAKRYITGDTSMQTLEEVLEVLGIEREHLGALKGKDTRYYDILRSTSKKDTFVDLMNVTIVKAIRDFSECIYTMKLFHAVEGNDLSTARDLLVKHANANALDAFQRTPLTFATKHGNEQMISLLLEHGARVTASDSNITPLHMAAGFGHFKCVELLLRNLPIDDRDEFVNRKTFGPKMTALHLAAENGSCKIVMILLEYGAIYCALNKKNARPIDICKDENTVKFLDFVDQCFRDVKNDDSTFLKPLENLEMQAVLALVNARDNNGMTLTKVATARGRRDLVEMIEQIVLKKRGDHLPVH